jgi:acetyl esterase/lipase
MKNFKPLYVTLILTCLVINQNTIAQIRTLEVWMGNIPGEITNKDYQEKQLFNDGTLKQVSQVVTPTLTIYEPEIINTNSTIAVLVMPGGGYSHLAIDKEGTKIAQWLNTLGITAFVLKYRLPNDAIMKDKSVGPLQDAQEAIRIIRRNAEKWKINTNQIGVIGFSAGGHLAASLSTHYTDDTYKESDTISARPDFAMLIYPVISMQDEITHKGSKNNLLGASPTSNTITHFSNEMGVSINTPPTFLTHATDDKAVPCENSIRYYLALKKHQVAAELHLYQSGGHGFGISPKETKINWTKDAENWLINNHFIK